MANDLPPGVYCRRDDLFIGWGAAGVVKVPEDRDVDWLSTHCWLCGRTRAELIAAEETNG